MTNIIIDAYQENEPDIKDLKDKLEYHKNVIQKYQIKDIQENKSKKKSPKILYQNLGYFITNAELNKIEDKT